MFVSAAQQTQTNNFSIKAPHYAKLLPGSRSEFIGNEFEMLACNLRGGGAFSMEEFNASTLI